MRRLFFLLGVGLLAAALLAASSVAAPPQTAIGTYDVAAAGTWTDPYDGQAYRVYQLTVAFTHKGPAELRVYEVVNGSRVDSNHLWFHGSGADTFTGTVTGGAPGQEVGFELVVGARGPHHELVVLDSMTIGPYSD